MTTRSDPSRWGTFDIARDPVSNAMVKAKLVVLPGDGIGPEVRSVKEPNERGPEGVATAAHTLRRVLAHSARPVRTLIPEPAGLNPVA